MFETNIQNHPTLISLSKAAEITGYHQDYLGQLCRLGHLPAKKVGRNWFTSQEALDNLSGNLVIESEQTQAQPSEAEVQEATDELKDLASNDVPINELSTNELPDLFPSLTISEVEGLPISIRTVATPVVKSNTVQSIATNMRIQALQREVTELREMLNRLMTEVSRHSELLKGQEFSDIWQKHHSLKHSYVSNFDLNPASYDQQEQEPAAAVIFQTQKPQLEIITWLAATSALAAIAFLLISAVSGTLLGHPQEVQTVYYTPKTYYQSVPTVAGESTVQTSGSTSNVLQ